MSAQGLSKSSVFCSASRHVNIGLAVAVGALGLWGVPAALLTGSAIAQVGLSPMLIQAEVELGQGAENVSRTVTVKNPSDDAVRVQMYAEPFTYDRRNGFVLLDEDSRDLSRDLTPHLQFSPREFVLMPNAERSVQVVGTLPSDLAETEYRAVILADSFPEDGAADRGIVQTRIGSTLYLRQSASVPSFDIVRAQWNADEHQAELLVSNVGEATARPNARWTITRNGDAVATGQSGATTVIEGGDRLIPLPYFNESGAALPPGDYEISGALTWHFGAEHASQPFRASLRIQ